MAQTRIVIVGGGFGGLAAAKALKRSPAQITLIDRTNHHLFQPLLYQVATSALSPGQIGFPIRGILRSHKNTMVIMGEVTGVDKDEKCVLVSFADREDVPFAYDYLVLATGASHSYFGHDEFARYAPGRKNLADAVAIRNKILQAFEQAEVEEDPGRHPELLTFVLVGAGPTGVEMAGAIAILARSTLKAEFRRIDPSLARVILVDMANRVLGTFSEDLSAAAQQRLESLGVEVRLGTPYYTRIDAPATPEQKAKSQKLSPEAVPGNELAGEPITAKLTSALGNNAPIGGLKVMAAGGWFAARPSGTENIYKIYAESFKSEAHLDTIVSEARAMVNSALE